MQRKKISFTILQVIALALGTHMNAQAGLFGIGGDSWKEEVLLHDGKKIVVERSQTYGGQRELGQSAPIAEHKIAFALPGATKKITWVSEYGKELGRTNFNLFAVHLKDNIRYIVASPNLCLSYNKWGRPNPPYVFFKYESGDWKKIGIEALPTEFKTINVVVGIRGLQTENLVKMGKVSAEKVTELNETIETAESKSILKNRLIQGEKEAYGSAINCEEMVYYKEAWIGPGDSIGKRMMDGNSK